MELASTFHGGHSLHPPGLCFVLEFVLSHADSFKTSHFASYSVNKCQEFTQWAAPADLLTGSPPR